MASEIKIHLATYLKDAGIKASQQQINRLAQDVKRLNGDMAQGSDAVAQRLGRLPGAFGKIQGALGELGAKALGVIGAFKVGWDIGTWIGENVINPLLGIEDPLKRLQRENRELQRQAAEAVGKWEQSLAKWAAGWDKEVRGAEQARQKIEDLAQAYLKMQQARERIASAQGNAALLGMQRDKFDAMAGAATPEQAAQLGKYHDVLIAEVEAKQRLAAFDRQAEVSAQKRVSAEDALDKSIDKQARLKQQMVELDEKLEQIDSQQSLRELGWAGNDKAERDLLKRKEALSRQIEAADREVENRRADVGAMAAASQAEAIERANIEEKAKLEIDERKKSYDDYIAYVEQREMEAAAQEWNRQQEEIRKAVEQEQRERQRMEQQLAAQRISDLRTELSERQRMENNAISRQSAASGGLQTAWGWYRDQNSMQAVIDEQKAQQLAEQQWAKDFEKLKSKHRDWRDIEFGKLSAADESVRQVALAKEEKEAADRAVIETAENTRELADKLDELLQVKG